MPPSLMRSRCVRKQNLFVLAVTVVGVVCSAYFFRPIGQLADDEESTIEVIVLRYMFENNRMWGKHSVDYYFVSKGGFDPSSDVLAAFENHTPRVLQQSMAIRDLSKWGSPFLHEGDGQKGLLFTVRRVRPQRNGRVYVEGDYYDGFKGMGHKRLLLEHAGGEWVVVAAE